MTRLEGNGAARLIQLMQKAGYNRGIDIELATVIQTEPELKFKLRSDGFILDEDDAFINEDLLPMKETVKINGVDQVIEYPLQIKVGDSVLVARDYDAPLRPFFVLMKCISLV